MINVYWVLCIKNLNLNVILILVLGKFFIFLYSFINWGIEFWLVLHHRIWLSFI